MMSIINKAVLGATLTCVLTTTMGAAQQCGTCDVEAAVPDCGTSDATGAITSGCGQIQIRITLSDCAVGQCFIVEEECVPGEIGCNADVHVEYRSNCTISGTFFLNNSTYPGVSAPIFSPPSPSNFHDAFQGRLYVPCEAYGSVNFSFVCVCAPPATTGVGVAAALTCGDCE